MNFSWLAATKNKKEKGLQRPFPLVLHQHKVIYAGN